MGLSFSVNLKKNCRINFQCRRKNVIMVVYGKSDCGPCPAPGDDVCDKRWRHSTEPG